MVSLAEQTKNIFSEEPIKIPQMGLSAPLPDPYSPEIKELRKQIFTKDLPKALPRVAKGVALSIPAIPSDLVDLAKLANDLNNQYGPDFITKSPVTKFFTRAVDKTQKVMGREQFSKLMKSIGVNDNPSDPAQFMGEISTALLALPLAAYKTSTKVGKEGLKQIPLKQTALTKPKQTAISTKVDDTAPKDPSKRKFLKGMGATAIAPVAIKASALIPKADIGTAIQKSYQSLTPLIQNFRASTMNFDSNITTYFNQFNKAKAVGTSYADVVPATDKEGKPVPNLFISESSGSNKPINLNKQQENIIKNKEILNIETEKHLKLLHNEKRKISIATRIPKKDVHVVKSENTLDDMHTPLRNETYHFDEDIRQVDSLNNTYDAYGEVTGNYFVERNTFYDSPLTDSIKKIKNQAFILPDGNVIDNVTRLKAFRESINAGKINIARDFSLVLKQLQQNLDGYEVFQGEYPIAVEALKGKLTANDIKSWELSTGEKFPYKQFFNFFNKVFKNVNYLGSKEGFKDPLRQRIFRSRIYSNVYSFDKGTQDIQKHLDILNFMYSLSNKSKDMGLQSFGDNPLFNNLTDNQVLFIKDFYNPKQTMLKTEYFGGPALNVKSNFFYSSGIPDILTTKIRKTLKPLRTDVADAVLNTSIKNLKGEELKDDLLEYSGTSMYQTIQEGLPTNKELVERDKFPTTDYFYNTVENIDSLISFREKSKAAVFRSVKKLNKLLEMFNKGFQTASSKKEFEIKNKLEEHLYRLVKKNIPIDKARDMVNTSFKDSLLYSYYDRMNNASMLPEDFQKLFGTTGSETIKNLTKQFKELDNIYPTKGLKNQIYTKFLKANSQIPKNINPKDPDTQGYYEQGINAIRELDNLSLPKNLLKGINKIDKLTDQTTKLLKGADKAMTALEAPKVKYTKNVYHLGKGKIEGDKFNLMGESDFGIHVGTKGQADSMNKIKYGVVEPTMKPTLELEGKEIKALGQRTFPLQIADDLKPARIPDIESFKMPNKWLDHLAVASDDKAGMDYMTQTTEAKLDLKNRPQVEYKGVTYYMSDIAAEMDVKNYDPKLKQSMVREKMDEQLWKDLVLSALEEQTRRKKNKSLNFKERQVWFNKIKEVANKNGYDSFIYKNTGEQDQLDMNADSYMLLEQDQLKYKFSKAKTKGDPRLDKYKGGMI